MAASNAPAPTPTAPRRTLDVTALPPLGEVLQAAAEHLAAWMPRQRWYARKSAGAPAVRVLGWAVLGAHPSALVLDTVVEASAPEGARDLYQVPLVLRHPEGAPEGASETGGEIGVIAVPGGPLRIDDAARDAEGREAILRMLVSGSPAVGEHLRLSASGAVAADGALPWPGVEGSAPVVSRVLGGEQSNTSLIFESEGARPLILKLFRVVSDGKNPDVVLQSALSAAGCSRVPAAAGSAVLALGEMRTHAMFAQELLAGVEDAWRVALAEAGSRHDFRAPAADLGAALAEVHRELAGAFGRSEAEESVRAAMVQVMLERLAQASAEVEAVARRFPQLERLLLTAGSVPWPPLQRIHGDLHLGQVLSAPGRGWVLLDFEGEPLRPLAQRSLPDCPLRDVAGMLRSFDYAAGAVALERGIDAAAWAADARAAFLSAYVERAGAQDPRAMDVLLAAFEADKAVYEALYEARNRPDWLPIPLAAIERISAGAAGAGSPG